MNHYLVPKLAAYALTQSFSHASHYCGHDSSPPIAVYTVTGGPQYCDHLGPASERSVQWYAQWAASACACASSQGWMMVHHSYLYMRVVSNCYASWCSLYKLLLTTQLESCGWRTSISS